MPEAPGPALLAEVRRCGLVESRHYGSLVALDASGRVAFAAGEPAAPVFPRSCSKPLQAVGMLRSGLDLDGELLAVATASHSGEELHLQAVRRVLAGAGLDEAALGNVPDLPLGEEARAGWLRAGLGPARVAMNCSGKHAAMLATCVQNGWPRESYLDPDSPLQRALRATVEDLAGEESAAVATDGCGAPLLALSLTGLARAFRAIATAPPGSPEHRLAAAVRSHPVHLGGHGRDVTRLVTAVPGLLAKDGAEGVYAAATAAGAAVAVKVGDGAARARVPVLVAALRRLTGDTGMAAGLDEVPVYGGGRRVGEVRAAPLP